MIKIEHLTKSFNGQKTLDNISLEIKNAEVFILLGESGAGKTVLLKHMIGLIKPDEGKIFIKGKDITKLPEDKLLLLRKDIGYMFQEGALYDFMTVYENLAFPLAEHTNMDKKSIKQKVTDVLKMVDLEGVDLKYPSELSGGMRKRVGLARSIILDSKILFCDEPTSGLDPIRSRDISNLIKNLSKRLCCTTVITSHDIENSFLIADRLVLIKDGKIAALGTPDELKSSSDKFVKDFVR